MLKNLIAYIVYNWKTADPIEVGFSLNYRPKQYEYRGMGDTAA